MIILLCSARCREDWIRAIQSVAERLQVLDDFDGQFSEDMSRLSKLKKKVVSSNEAVAAADVACNLRVIGELGRCCKSILAIVIMCRDAFEVHRCNLV